MQWLTRSRAVAYACWLVAAAILGLGAWLVCRSPDCGAMPIDTALLHWFKQQHNDSADRLFRIITWLGSVAVLLPLILLAIGILTYRDRVREAYFLGSAMLGTIATMHICKLIVARPRPAGLEALVDMPWDLSFPSAHSAQITSAMLSTIVLSARSRVWLIGLLPIALLVVMLVGTSRVYLQVHYPSDVLAGILFAMLWVTGLAFWFFPQATMRLDSDAK